MKNLMAFATVLTLLSIATPVKATAATQQFVGSDDIGKQCSISISDLAVGKTTHKDPCFFEMDGPGPWCSGQAKIAVAPVTGQGTYATASGSVDFTINDKYERINANGSIDGFDGATAGNGTVAIAIKDQKMTVYYEFLTAYGQSLTADQIRHLLLDRGPDFDYNKVKSSLYVNENCVINLP